jgi:hypothetical protein
MTKLVKTEFDNIAVTFSEDAWLNATAIAERFAKNPHEWLRLPATREYLNALGRKYGNIPYFRTRRGQNGGTWLHPKLGVMFARWVDIDFAVWCDDQIFQILSGLHVHYDWKKSRHETSASFKVLGQVLQLTRQRLGKTCAPHHFSNEARMINRVLMGKFGKIDRDGLCSADLDLLAKLETLDTVLIGCGTSYDDRKKELEQFASLQRNRAPTSGLQSTALPWRKVTPCCALDKPSNESATSHDVLAES